MIEEVLGGVRHFHLLAGEVAGISGSPATHRIHSLDESHAVENSRSLAGGFELQPVDGSWIWGGALLMAMGGGLALSDRRYSLAARKQREAKEIKKAEATPAIAAASVRVES